MKVNRRGLFGLGVGAATTIVAGRAGGVPKTSAPDDYYIANLRWVQEAPTSDLFVERAIEAAPYSRLGDAIPKLEGDFFDQWGENAE